MVNKAPCKRTQHCWPTTPNLVGCYMLRPFAHLVACCWMLLRVVAQSLKPVKLFSQQPPTFLLFRDRRSVAQQCWIRLHSSSNIVGATHAITHGLQRLMGCILPTMHWRSQHCWELLHPFSHHCQHARNNPQQEDNGMTWCFSLSRKRDFSKKLQEKWTSNCQCYCTKQIDNILTSFLWSIRVHTMENCCRFVN